MAWRTGLEHTDRPTALCLTRQNLPMLDRGASWPRPTAWPRGGYVLAEAAGGAPRR